MILNSCAVAIFPLLFAHFDVAVVIDTRSFPQGNFDRLKLAVRVATSVANFECGPHIYTEKTTPRQARILLQSRFEPLGWTATKVADTRFMLTPPKGTVFRGVRIEADKWGPDITLVLSQRVKDK